MMGISPVRSNAGQAVWGHREYAFPRVVDAGVGEGGKQRFKVVAYSRVPLLNAAARPRPDTTGRSAPPSSRR
jgi:hypothetical protein